MKKNARQIIRIDETRCNGCGLCASACAEGAIRMVDGKAKLVSETYCDGLGACLGKCPVDAITIETREAKAFDPTAVERHLAGQGKPHAPPAPAVTAKPAAPHPHHAGCPGTLARMFTGPAADAAPVADAAATGASPSWLRQWPVQLRLVPVSAPWWDGADLLLAADCTAFALGAFHGDLLRGRRLAIACPKLDDTDGYEAKLTAILAQNNIRSVTVAIMEVPCCQGLRLLAERAVAASGKTLPLRTVTITVDGRVE